MGARLLLISLLLGRAASATPPVPILPPGRPAPERLAAADPGFTLNEEVLVLNGFTLKQYQEMPSDEQSRVFDWLRILETERRLAAARRNSGAAAVPASPAAEPGSGDTLARLRSAADPAALFDGAKTTDAGTALVPALTLSSAGVPKRFTLTAPDGLALEGGMLGVDGKSPLVASSPYLGLGKGSSGSGSALDYDLKWRVSAVNLGARLFTDDAPEIDARIDKGIESLRTLSPATGVTGEHADAISRSLSFAKEYETAWLFYGSALARAGRAYHLLPGLDAGWSAMGVMRVAGVFPNATTDQTAGLRLRPGGGQNVGVFGGVTEALGLFKETVVADSLDAGKLKTSLHPELAPHAELAAWGKVPYLSGAQYTVSAGRQWNPWTTLTSVSAAVDAPVGGMKAGAFGRWSGESGSAMEFSRDRTSAGLSITPTPGLDLSAAYTRDSASLGTARIDSSGVMFGLTLSETGGPAKGASVTMESLFGGREQLVSPEEQSRFAAQLGGVLDLLLVLKGAAAGPAGLDGGWDAAKAYWNGFDPDTRAAVAAALAAYAPGAPSIDQLLAIKGSDVKTLDRLVDLLSDTKVLERILVRVVRSALLKKLDTIDVPVFGKTRLSAPMVFAAANAYSLGVTPLPAVTAKDQLTLDALIIDRLGKQAGCSGAPDAVTACVLGKLPPDAAKALKSVYGDDLAALLQNAVDWPSGVLRREVDRLALQVMLAAEALDELSVDKGEKIADMNVRGLMDSFSRLDRRGRATAPAVLKGAAESLKAELAARDAAMRAKLADYGARRLSWLQAQPAWPSNVRIAVRSEDWPVLLAVYGDAALFDLILRCKTRLAAAHPSDAARLLIEVDRNPLGAASLRRGPVAVLGLPPVKRGLADLSLDF